MPAATGLAMLGHCVVCCECDTNRRNVAAMGRAPFVDKGLDDALAKTVKSGALRFCADVVAAVANADAVMVSVPVSDEDNGLEGLQAIVADVAAVARPIVCWLLNPPYCRELAHICKACLILGKV